MLKRVAKVAAGLVGAVAVGAAGSGVWDLFGRALLFWCIDVMLKVASFGYGAISDAPYAQAALGLREYPSAFLVLLLVAVAMGATWAKLEEASRSPGPKTEADAAQGRARRRVQGYFYLGTLTFFVFQAFQLLYAHRVIGHFNRCLTIVGPALDTTQEKALRARFAWMKGEKDWRALTATIDEIAKAHSITLPAFQ